MKTWLIALVILVPVEAYSREISVDELSGMTVPQLAQAAYTECADRVDGMRKSMEDIRQSKGSGPDYGRQMFKRADEALAEANVHKENLSRIQVVVRKQLNGEEPAWIEAYTTARESAGCANAKAQYDAWAKEHKIKPAPKSKKAPGKKAGE